MAKHQWKGIDLNLLIAFQALYDTNSVSLAAEQCFVSQSAMSHTLQRMRTQFDDPLFERVGIKMQPTARAREIAPVVERLLNSVQAELLSKPAFEPHQYSGRWKIGLTDYAEQLYAPALYDAIKLVAPESQISFYNVNRHNYIDLSTQEKLDVIIGSIGNLDPRFSSEHLYTEKHLCLYDPNSVSVTSPFSIEQFVSVEHALVSPDGQVETQTDKLLEEHGYTRRVSVTSRHFLTIRRLLIGRELICIVPKRFAEMEVDTHGLSVVEPPVEVGKFDIKLLYARSLKHEEKNIWLRSKVRSVVKE